MTSISLDCPPACEWIGSSRESTVLVRGTSIPAVVTCPRFVDGHVKFHVYRCCCLYLSYFSCCA